MSGPGAVLTPASRQALAEAALVLQHAQGFIFLPLLVQSERAGALALALLRPALNTDPYRVAWPLSPAHEDDEALREARAQADLTTLLQTLDDATHRLPPGADLLIDAASGARAAVARRLPVFLNQRREDWRRLGHRVLLLWPQGASEALMQGAPDLWSMRAAAPWIEETTDSGADRLAPISDHPVPRAVTDALSPAQQRQWRALQQSPRWAEADVSGADVLALIAALRERHQVGSGLDLAEEMMAAPETQGQPPAWRARLMVELTLLRRAAGDLMGALAPAQEAVLIYRRLAQASPAAYEPDLAGSLNNLAAFLNAIGDRAGALDLAQEAVAIRRRLAQASPAAYEPDLAVSLNNLATFLSDTGDRAGALAPAQEAVAISRRLAQANPAAYEPDLAMSQNNLANRLSDTGDRAGALPPAQEAVTLYRRLAQANPAAYEPDLAMSLNNLAKHLSETGDRAGALAPAQEAVAIGRRLAQVSPAAYEPDLAGSLNNLANHLSKTGDRAGALAPAQEAVAISRRLAQASPAAYEPNLAVSLWTAMKCHAAGGQTPEALAHGRAALALYTRLAETEPARFGPDRRAVEAELQALGAG